MITKTKKTNAVHSTIKQVAVIGAGVMGAGIAAHIANAGVQVLLLDIVPKGGTNRNAIAEAALEKLKKSNPAAFMHPANAKLVTPGNTEDNLVDLKQCDWIIEAVIERLDIKQALYKKLSAYAKKTAIISSNTSTLPLAQLVAGLPESFTSRFLITHFFNPPRYMRLLEVVTGPHTHPKITETITKFADESLGKTIVPCFDTPGFIANRIGTYWLHAATVQAIKQGIGVEEADAVLGKPAGIPKTGVFGLLDLVGLDLMPHILESMFKALPETDAFHALGPAPSLLNLMIRDGNTGRKGKGGFYRKAEDGTRQVMNLSSGRYIAAHKPKVAATKKGLKHLVTHDSHEGRYAWSVLSATLAYAADLVGEIAEDLEHIDRAMRLGYNWKWGPFQLIDKLGTAWFANRLKAEGRAIPRLLQVAAGRPLYRVHEGRLQFLTMAGLYQPVPRAPGVLLLEDIKRAGKPVLRNMSASVWDVGDGIACFEFTSKMNSLNPLILMLLAKSLKKLPEMGFKGMVIYNEGTNFSVGANIGLILIAAMFRAWFAIRMLVGYGQKVTTQLKYAPFPVVAAPSGLTLGGGCEIVLHSHAVVAHAETYIGLVEVGVGIIPGWGGCKELLGRVFALGKKGKGPMPAIAQTFETIATAKVATSAAQAKDLLYLRPTDHIVMNRDRLLAAAKTLALALAPHHKTPEAYTYNLPGPSGAAALGLALHDFALKGQATPHDVTVGTALAEVLTGGSSDVLQPLTEENLITLERAKFMQLVKTPQTLARVRYMLTKGKPLRN